MTAMPSCILYFVLCLASAAIGAWNFADWFTHGTHGPAAVAAFGTAALMLLMFMIEAEFERFYRWLMGVPQ